MAVCPAQKRPAWKFYSWQAVIPAGTSIAFTAQTKELLADPYGAAVSVGTANFTTANWTSLANTVEQQLVAAGQVSKSYLRVTSTLNPSSNPPAAPTLNQWQLSYDCVDAI